MNKLFISYTFYFVSFFSNILFCNTYVLLCQSSNVPDDYFTNHRPVLEVILLQLFPVLPTIQFSRTTRAHHITGIITIKTNNLKKKKDVCANL